MTLKMAAWVAETCWWPLHHKVRNKTKVHLLVFNTFYASDWCTEYGTYQNDTAYFCHHHRDVWEVAFWSMRSLSYILCQQPRYLGAVGNVRLSNYTWAVILFVEINQFFVIWLLCGLLLLGKIFLVLLWFCGREVFFVD